MRAGANPDNERLRQCFTTLVNPLPLLPLLLLLSVRRDVFCPCFSDLDLRYIISIWRAFCLQLLAFHSHLREGKRYQFIRISLVSLFSGEERRRSCKAEAIMALRVRQRERKEILMKRGTRREREKTLLTHVFYSHLITY